MAITAFLAEKHYTGNGATTEFEYANKINSASELRIANVVIATDVTSDWTNGVDYEAVGFGTNLITITPTIILPSTERIVIYSEPDLLQENDYIDLDQFPADRLEGDLDTATIGLQSLWAKIRRLATIPIQDWGGVQFEFPSIAARKNNFLSFDEDGAPESIVNKGFSVDLITAPGTSYTVGSTDVKIEMVSVSANTVTIPPQSDVDFSTYKEFDVIQFGTGNTTIVAGVGVTVSGSLSINRQYAAVSVYKRAENDWVVIGGV